MKKIDYIIAPTLEEAVEKMIKIAVSKARDFRGADDVMLSIRKGALQHIWVIKNYINGDFDRLQLEHKIEHGKVTGWQIKLVSNENNKWKPGCILWEGE